jgi:hypothetical protein
MLAPFGPFWRRVHDEERINLPALPELLPVLWELDMYLDLAMFAWPAPETVPNRAMAVALLRQILYVKPESEQDARLCAALDDLALETPGGIMLRESQPRHEGFLSWRVDR